MDPRADPPDPQSAPSRLLTVAALAIALGAASFLVNVSTPAQQAGGAEVLRAVRLLLSRLLNSGTVWAGAAILAGCVARRPVRAAAAGIWAPLLALVVHYALAALTGWVPGLSWRDNLSWFAAAAVLGAPLGLIGALSRRPGTTGLLAALVVPAGAVLEPLVRGRFAGGSSGTWPGRFADVGSGALLLGAGLAVAVVVLLRRRTPVEAPVSDDGAAGRRGEPEPGVAVARPAPAHLGGAAARPAVPPRAAADPQGGDAGIDPTARRGRP